MDMGNNHLSKINELEKMASEVLKLKKLHRQRRPIVIEFCGSPKAGKTSTINALNIFLKRNGFKTTILSERAGESPISDKHTPIFNVWTCTSAINEINEKMDRAQHGEEIDIIISDRGIFDALCWFKWLKSQSHMSEKEFEILTAFSTLYRWQKNIDLVYVFMVSPEKSIEREYANLLTTKRGSIMREDVLAQYLDSVKETMDEYQLRFRAVHQIDTSDISQNDVSYEVTYQTLEVLKNMLIEKIGYFELAKLSLKDGFNNIDDHIDTFNQYRFKNRDIVEKDDKSVQPIPIAVITTLNNKKILCIRKTKRSTSPDSPESNRMLLYAGGHTRVEDEPIESEKKFYPNCKKYIRKRII